MLYTLFVARQLLIDVFVERGDRERGNGNTVMTSGCVCVCFRVCEKDVEAAVWIAYDLFGICVFAILSDGRKF